MLCIPARRLLAALALLGCASLSAACGNACLDLASQICACYPDDSTRSACRTRAKEESGIFPIRPDDESYCQAKLDAKACDCTKLASTEGQLACGVAFPTYP
jgi:hypothetical protein